jgi:hypothetical protein
VSDNFSDDSNAPRGRRVGNYEILEEIGAGGMSRVYRGRRLSDGEVVAVKVIHIENMAPDYEARLRREPEVQHGIGHENIVGLHESFREREEFFLVMEYVDGRSLARIIHHETGPMSFERARGYFRQVLRAVDHLHRLGIVHRDIKPSNILVRWDDMVKIADFGIAKFTWQQAQTKTQRGLGTPEYMSPEQARGQQVDHRSDIYSLGITLFEALTARKPFSRDEETPAAYGEVIQEILNKPLPDPRAFVPSLTNEVVRLLKKATAKDPAERFQSCSEFLGALEIIEGEGAAAAPRSAYVETSTPTVTLEERPRPASTRRAEPAPTVVPGAAPTAASRPVARAAEPPKRSALPWILLLLVVLGVGGYFGYQWYQNQHATVQAHRTDADAMRISKGVAADVKKYQVDANAPALASLFDAKGLEFFKMKNATREAVAADIARGASHIVRTDQYDIDVRRARMLDDSTVETEWIITYQRTKDDGTLLRGSTSNIVKLKLVDDQWLITSERENWTKRNNVAPPKAADTAASDTPQVVDIPQNQGVPDKETQVATVRMFMSMVTGGDANEAWDIYASTPLKASDERTRFNSEFAGKGAELQDVSAEGDVIVAKVARNEGDGTQHIYRIYCTVLEEGGSPRVSSVRVNSR